MQASGNVHVHLRTPDAGIFGMEACSGGCWVVSQTAGEPGSEGPARELLLLPGTLPDGAAAGTGAPGHTLVLGEQWPFPKYDGALMCSRTAWVFVWPFPPTALQGLHPGKRRGGGVVSRGCFLLRRGFGPVCCDLFQRELLEGNQAAPQGTRRPRRGPWRFSVFPSSR